MLPLFFSLRKVLLSVCSCNLNWVSQLNKHHFYLNYRYNLKGNHYWLGRVKFVESSLAEFFILPKKKKTKTKEEEKKLSMSAQRERVDGESGIRDRKRLRDVEILKKRNGVTTEEMESWRLNYSRLVLLSSSGLILKNINHEPKAEK